jgi:hypothetical protein
VSCELFNATGNPGNLPGSYSGLMGELPGIAAVLTSYSPRIVVELRLYPLSIECDTIITNTARYTSASRLQYDLFPPLVEFWDRAAMYNIPVLTGFLQCNASRSIKAGQRHILCGRLCVGCALGVPFVCLLSNLLAVSCTASNTSRCPIIYA